MTTPSWIRRKVTSRTLFTPYPSGLSALPSTQDAKAQACG
jgi:hypothetical protein